MKEIAQVVAMSAFDTGAAECRRAWRVRNIAERQPGRQPGRANQTAQTCEYVLDEFVKSVGGVAGGEYSGRRLRLMEVREHVRQFAERRGLVCKTLTAGNVGSKLSSLYGCIRVYKH